MNIDSNLHSHPSMPQQNLWQILSGMNIRVHLKGLSSENISNPTDVYCPQVRRSIKQLGGGNRQGVHTEVDLPIEHLDAISCWKGLTFQQAAGVALWERLFKECLEKQALRALLSAFVERSREYSGSNDIMVRVLECIMAKDNKLINIDIAALIHDMMQRYYKRKINPRLNWFISSQNLPRTIYNFVRTHDCFLPTPNGPRLQLKLSYEILGETELHFYGDVKWQPPIITFANLSAELSPGDEYQINPQYHEPDQNADLMSAFQSFPVTIDYSVTSLELGALDWNSTESCFRTTVPEAKYLKKVATRGNALCTTTREQVITVKTIVSATLVKIFPDNVRFERTTRHSIGLRITLDHLAESPLRRPENPVDAELDYGGYLEDSIPISHFTVEPGPEDSMITEDTFEMHLTSRSPSPVTSSVDRARFGLPTPEKSAPRWNAFRISTDEGLDLEQAAVRAANGVAIADAIFLEGMTGRRTVKRDPFESLRERLLSSERPSASQPDHSDNSLPAKRKASKQLTVDATTFDSAAAAFERRRPIREILKWKLDMARKQQRVEPGHDLESILDRVMESFGQSDRNERLVAEPTISPDTLHWYKRAKINKVSPCGLKPRDYRAKDTRVMPTMKKKGSVNRILFRQRPDKKQTLPTPPPTPPPISPLSLSSEMGDIPTTMTSPFAEHRQFEIVHNYINFALKKAETLTGIDLNVPRGYVLDGAEEYVEGQRKRAEESESRAFERIWMGWDDAEADMDLGALSV